MELGYSYINARIAGMKGILFSDKDYRLLLSQDDTASTFLFLKSTPYSEDIRRIKGCDNIGRIREGLNRNVYLVFKKINRIVDGESKRLLLTLLGWWNIYNIKIILRGKEGGRSNEEIQSFLVSTGTTRNRKLVELLQHRDLNSLIPELGEVDSSLNLPEVGKLYEAYLAGGLILLESLIEKAYFEDTLKKAKANESNNPIAVRIIRFQIDRANIMTGVRITNKDGLDPEVHYIEGGEHISLPIYREFIKDKNRLIERLPHINKIMSRQSIKEEDLLTPERISALERRIEMGMLKDLFQTSLIDTYSIGVITGYIWRKVNEVINLNTILYGRLNGMPNEAIRELLVII